MELSSYIHDDLPCGDVVISNFGISLVYFMHFFALKNRGNNNSCMKLIFLHENIKFPCMKIKKLPLGLLFRPINVHGKLAAHYFIHVVFTHEDFWAKLSFPCMEIHVSLSCHEFLMH